MKIKIHKDWYKETMKRLNYFDKKNFLTEHEKTEYEVLLDIIDYIYRCNGYT